MNQSEKVRYKWNEIPWRKLEKKVFKLQKRIYRASQSGNVKLVHQLQKLLLKSRSAKFLATRRVTQDNRGRKTAGVDGIANLKQTERLILAESLSLKGKSEPVRRIWIPKPGKTEKRPLGIPTMTNRAQQALLKMALEPEWEAKFEPNSYGFRPGRSCHDACEAIFKALSGKNAFVLDADISGCFDNIDHNRLLEKLNTTSEIYKVIKRWLGAGIMEGNVFQTTERGTPQGGVISPLLANIALHGMEHDTKNALTDELFQYRKNKYGKATRTGAQEMISIIRYADDFVVIHESKEVVFKAKSYIEEWLKTVGLKLNLSKTKIIHTLNSNGEEKPGFDFLGFTMRQVHTKCRKKGYKLLIKPSQKAVKRHAAALEQMVKKMRGESQQAVIYQLNLIIKGWSRYYTPGVSCRTFSKLDSYMFQLLWRWALYRHPKKGKAWIKKKYFCERGNRKWQFGTHNGVFLTYHSDHAIKRHVKIKGMKSPYDGDWVYWAVRMGKSPGVPTRVAKLMKMQHGKCGRCQLWFRPDDLVEVHHRNHQSSDNRYENLELLHGHCHDDLHKGCA